MIGTLVLALSLVALPVAQQSETIDFDAEVERISAEIVAEEIGAELVWVQDPTPTDPDKGYWKMLYSNSYDPAQLVFFAASVAEMYSNSVLQNQCAQSTIVECTNPFPGSVQEDALVTAGVYAGVTALQRLAKTQWDVDLDEGWKNLVIWGSLATIRSIVTASNVSDANALRELGR